MLRGNAKSDKRAMGSTDNQSHQLAFQVKNEQLGGNVGKETSCFLLEMGELCHLLHQSPWQMQYFFSVRCRSPLPTGRGNKRKPVTLWSNKRKNEARRM